MRGALELVGDELLRLVRGGTAPDAIGVVCPSLGRWRAPLETAFGRSGFPTRSTAAGGSPRRRSDTRCSRCFATRGPTARRADLFAFLRSPYSGLTRAHVDFVEGRLRGRAVAEPERIEAVLQELRGSPLRQLDALRSGTPAVDAVRALAQSMLRAAHGLEHPPVGESPAATSAHSTPACACSTSSARGSSRVEELVSADDVIATLERARMRGERAEPGKVTVLDLERARTGRFEVVFVLGLEEGSLPRRGGGSPFLDDEGREGSAADCSARTR